MNELRNERKNGKTDGSTENNKNKEYLHYCICSLVIILLESLYCPSYNLYLGVILKQILNRMRRANLITNTEVDLHKQTFQTCNCAIEASFPDWAHCSTSMGFPILALLSAAACLRDNRIPAALNQASAGSSEEDDCS